MPRSVRLECTVPGTPLVKKAVELLRRRIIERCGSVVTSARDAECAVLLGIEPGIGREGFRVEEAEDHSVRIVGNDERGLLYGVGKFLRSSRFDEGVFTAGAWRGTSVPEKEVRGMYLATHFHNFYHEAPIERVERYIEEMALWGCNALSVWFDMHHYTGIDDPEAQDMIERLHQILKAANRVGMGAGLTTLSNEAYSNSPEELRSVPHKLGHYGVELCPSKPAAMELMLKWRQEVLAAFSDLDIEYVWIWPYDQGGCRCDACAPWGANGFLKIGEQVAKLVYKTFPQAKTVLSTWCFDYEVPGEYEGLWQTFDAWKHWADYLMVDAHGDFPQYVIEHGAPGNLPVLNFTEISMYLMHPWGGFGANPLPHTIQARWDASKHLLSGGFPYSEGIYEDLNKAILFQLYWDPEKPVRETVREYAAYEYAPEAADEVAQAIERMESVQQHGLKSGWREMFQGDVDTADAALYTMPKVEEPERNLDLLQSASDKLSAPAKQAWRWRILWLRAALDCELHYSHGKATRKSDEYFEELTAIYAAEKAELAVTPPSPRALRRLA